METGKVKSNLEQVKTDEDAGVTIRLGRKHADIIKKAKDQINSDATYKKKISLSRYIEKLIEDHWEKPIEALKKEREGAKDWLEIQYKKSGTNMSFFDWLKSGYQSKQPKSVKTSANGEK